MEFIDDFIEEWLKTHKRISWAAYFKEVKGKGYCIPKVTRTKIVLKQPTMSPERNDFLYHLAYFVN